jgi:hypothetical protein
MADRLADAQLPLRATGRGALFLMMAGHSLENHLDVPAFGHEHCHCFGVETNETSMAGRIPAIALSQFQLKKIRALR